MSDQDECPTEDPSESPRKGGTGGTRTPRDVDEVPGDEEEVPGDVDEAPGDVDEVPGDEEEVPGDEDPGFTHSQHHGGGGNRVSRQKKGSS
ncbi:hypothetical protein NHX12_020698 [Muraenolepis orangiensis]|uniref:Uncharacterized protein n=1 Tax=Muraenolepis orangiensis TaxID=630683 RepID=A0A9Q0EXK6_9TELE|nr:hypothetical protein NHX12_020698 [Muraenolepis orangiensis]